MPTIPANVLGAGIGNLKNANSPPADMPVANENIISFIILLWPYPKFLIAIVTNN